MSTRAAPRNWARGRRVLIEEEEGEEGRRMECAGDRDGGVDLMVGDGDGDGAGSGDVR